MKIWKTIGCLALLCVIVAGCVVLGQQTEVSAQAPTATEQPSGGGAEVPKEEPPTSDTEVPKTEETITGNAVVGKTYSQGLYFRSNGDGTCALAGMGDCTDACVLVPPQSPAGEEVIEILPYAFSGSIVGAVEIPATVQAVSAASFTGCARLGYVRVAPGNGAITESDGVLYTADGSVLLYCPAGRTAKSLVLHPSVKRIAAGAFSECAALENVYFSGNTAQWHNVIIGGENDALYRAALHFSKS